MGISVDLPLIRTCIRAVSLPFLCSRGYEDSQNTTKAKEKDTRGHGEDMRISPRACSGIFRGILMVTGI